MMNADLFLAWKYFKPKRNAVSVITLISVIGVGLGVGVLIVVLAVMTGFTDTMKEKIMDTTAHAQIYPYTDGYFKHPERLAVEAEKLGAETLPVIAAPVLLQSESRFIPKQLVAFDPEQKACSRFSFTLLHGKRQMEKGEVLISYLAAEELGLSVGGKILLHSPNNLSKLVKKNDQGKMVIADEAYLPGEYTVAGIFSFGKYDFDKNVLFLGLEDADELFNIPLGSATNVYIWTRDPYDMDGFITSLKEALPYVRIYSWQDMNKRLLGVLAVEKNMQFFLLAFIVLVAAFSITNTLITTVIQKTKEIGLLKALGASPAAVMRIFILQGFFVGLIGTGFGICLGCLVVKYRMLILKALRFITGQEIFPQEIYVFKELPAHIVTTDIVWVAVISILLCTLGGIIPAFRAASLDPANALRNE